MRYFRKLNQAIAAGDVHTAKDIISSGQDVSYLGWQALRVAAQHGQAELVQILASMADNDGRMDALLAAAETEHQDVIALLQPMVDLNVEHVGERAFEIALQRGQDKIVAFLWAHRNPWEHSHDRIFEICLNKHFYDGFGRIMEQVLGEHSEVRPHNISTGLRVALNSSQGWAAARLVRECMRRKIGLRDHFFYGLPESAVMDELIDYLNDKELKHISNLLGECVKGSRLEAFLTHQTMTAAIDAQHKPSASRKKM